MMSFVAETAIFLYVGMDALDIEKWKITKLRYQFTVLYFLCYRKLSNKFKRMTRLLVTLAPTRLLDSDLMKMVPFS